MLVRPAENSFRSGMEALSSGQTREALVYFEAAVELERRFGAARPQARYLSYYGLCLGIESGRLREGVAFCREATTIESFNADLWWNLGRVLLAADRRREAHQAFRKGLRQQSGHPGILREMERMGIRRQPAIPFLSRANFLNVILGRLTRNGAARTA